MSYSRKNVEAVRLEFEARHVNAENDRENRLNIVYDKIPELISIDAELSKTGLKIMDAVMGGKDVYNEKIGQIKEESQALSKKRGDLLEANGFSRDFTDYRYICSNCSDYGFRDGKMCACYKEALIKKQYESSGLGKLLDTQSFNTFSLDYYTEKEEMSELVSYLKDYVESFDDVCKNLLFVGGTGLGKTHLSTAIAKALIEKGHNVVYETAQNIFADFEKDRFRDHYDQSYEMLGDKYLEAELLIIDDLGAEMVTSYSVSCLYNIINTRVNRGLPIIASTNLASAEIRKIYNDRITSRLFGEFSIKKFVGSDIRKINKKI